METPNTDMLRGRVDIFVLKALSENDGYGYDILNYIHSRTEGHYEMKQSSVYSVLKRLEKQGYVYSYVGDETNGAKRRYYSLTDAGKELLQNEEKEWAYTRTLLDNLVSDKMFDLKNDTPPFHPSDLRPMTKRTPKDDEYSFASVSNETETPVEEDYVTQNDTKIEPEIAATEDKIEEEKPKTSSFTSTVEQAEKNANLTGESLNTFAIKENYRDFFGSLYTKPEANPQKEYKKSEIDTIDCSHINDLKSKLEDEGIKLRFYEKTNSRKGLMKYILINKLMRDSIFISYLFLVVCLLIVYLVKAFDFSLAAMLIIGGIMLIVPVISLLISVNNPLKRKNDNLNVLKILAICAIIYLAVFIIDIIVCLIIPNGYSLNSAPTYAACIICLVIPFFGCIFSLLYKTKRYHMISK